MDRSSRQSSKECTFTDAVGLEVRETRHVLCNDRVQFLIVDMSVGQISDEPMSAIL